MSKWPHTESPRWLLSLLGAGALHGWCLAGFTSGVEAAPVKRATLVPTAVDITWPERPRPPTRTQASAQVDERSRVPEKAPSGAGRGAETERVLRAPRPSKWVSSLRSEELSGSDAEEAFPVLDFGPRPGDSSGVGTGSGDSAREGGGSGNSGVSSGATAASGPKLFSSTARCADLFPYDARVTRGQVTVAVSVDAEGRGSFREISSVSPLRQGFEEAARFCAQRLRFQPARDARGEKIPSSTRVRLTFERTR